MTFPRPPFPLAFLPNVDGFAFVGVKRDGSRIPCRVERGPDGLHRIAGGLYTELIGWMFPPRPTAAAADGGGRNERTDEVGVTPLPLPLPLSRRSARFAGGIAIGFDGLAGD